MAICFDVYYDPRILVIFFLLFLFSSILHICVQNMFFLLCTYAVYIVYFMLLIMAFIKYTLSELCPMYIFAGTLFGKRDDNIVNIKVRMTHCHN